MKKKFLIAGILLVSALLGGGLALLYHLPLDTRDRAPEQPIPFSHRLHAGEYDVDCRYCHRYVEKSSVAGIPDMETCSGCHLYIAPENENIKQLMGLWQRQEPVAWVRLHTLPDHVYFPHNLHLRADIACAHCHGDVAAMQVMERTENLKMGWCLDCHRDNRASIDCWTCHI